jgi:hypothetical protein
MLGELKLIQIDCLALATGLQRNRIRAAYGIRGRYSTDICLSLCCTSCVMAQNDREIQAREGSVRYIGRVKDIKGQRHRTTGVKEIQAIHASAPPRIEPMRYVSPRETTEHTSRDSSAPPSHIQGHQTVHEGRSVEPRMPRLAFMKSRKYSVKHTNSQHGTKPESLAGVAEQVLTPNESFNSEGRRISRPDNEMEQCSQQHGPSECFRAGTEDQHTDYRAESPVLANKRAELGTSISDTPYGLTAAHSATESDADNAAASLRGKRSNVGVTGGQELSYTHDFSDCPVNKSVLMYYEKEENRSVKSAVNDSAGRCLSSNNPYKNALGDCVVNSHCSEKDAIIGERTQLLDTAGRSRRPSRHCQVDSSRVSITRSAEDFVARPISYCIDPRAEKKATSY